MTEPFAPYCLRCFAALPPTDDVRLGAKCRECGRRDSPHDRARYRSLHPDDVRRERITRWVWFLVAGPALAMVSFMLGKTWFPVGFFLVALGSFTVVAGLYTGNWSRDSAARPLRERLLSAAGWIVFGIIWAGLFDFDDAVLPFLAACLAWAAWGVTTLPDGFRRIRHRYYRRFDPTRRRLRERGLLPT